MTKERESAYPRIGERMILGGYINENQRDIALKYQQTHPVSFGQALLSLGFITAEELQKFLLSDSYARLGEQLTRRGIITEDQLEQALKYQKQHGGRLGSVCVTLGFITQQQLDAFIAGQPGVSRRLGEALLERKLITQQQLDAALMLQKNSGGRLGDILVYQKAVTPDDLYRVLADLKKMGRAGSETLELDHNPLPYEMALRLHAVVIGEEKDYVITAVEEALSQKAIDEIRDYTGKNVEQVLTGSGEFFHFFERFYSATESKKSVFGLFEAHPENSAIVTFTTPQIVFMLVLISLFVVFGVVFFRERTLLILMIIFQAIYLLMAVGKFYIVIKGAKRDSQLRFSKKEVDAIDERELPIYTVLIPVYKEKEVIRHLLERVEAMDYPKHKLDVRILLEEDDKETIACVQEMHLPDYFTPVIVPYSMPKTKPKACNYGLIGSRGEYVVIYDAEDRPEKDQLKKAYLAFQTLPEDYVCVQAKLNYFNSRQNWLTKLFTQEYSMWFELLLVGIMQIDIPIPLGGTSNHFRASFLKEVGGWDPFNVTEDADLGIRLYKYHYRTAVLDSRTWEEANSNLKNWIRQRSRWFKGYMQTFFVHTRNPIRFFRTLGFKGTLGYMAMIFGTPFLPLINPIFWALLIIWLVFEPPWVQAMFPGALYYLAAVQLVLGNFIFLYMNMVGSYYVIRDCAEKGEQPFSFSIIRFALLTPIYWVFMSVAAYKALFQLFVKPFYWEKTNHGLPGSQNTQQGPAGSNKKPQ